MSSRKFKCQVLSARIVDESRSKQYVAYKIMIEIGGNLDQHPAIIERRYSDFLALYNALKKDQPEVMSQINFPRKVLIGNFSLDMIALRSSCFKELLYLISSTSSLKEVPAFISFLYYKDMVVAHSLITKELYYAAIPVVENSFWLLSKFWTDRTPVVLRCLCLLVAIMAKTMDPNTLSLSNLALNRYQTVSDIDLLKYYVPLVRTALEVTPQSDQDVQVLTQHLDDLKKKGYNVTGAPSLLSVVMSDFENIIAKL